MKITLKEVIFTLIVGAICFGLGRVHEYKKIKLYKIDIEEEIKEEPNSLQLDKQFMVKWETVTMNVSAYCPCAKCCGIYADGITASGHKIAPGDVFVAAPKKYPFGTEMIIEGYAGGKAVKVEDVGGAIKGNKLDLFFLKHQQALNWGRKQVNVRVRVKG